MQHNRMGFLFLNIGHAYTHLFMLLYPTAVLTMGGDFPGSYGRLLELSVFGFIAFGVGSLPAGWLGDRWSRRGMMIVFFFGIGASSIFTAFATSPVGVAVGLTAIGSFAAIYHPVGISLVSANAERVGRDLGINGVWGNAGVALAAITAGFLSDSFGWRAAFWVPGVIAMATGVIYALFVHHDSVAKSTGAAAAPAPAPAPGRNDQLRVFVILAIATVAGSTIFNSTTIAMPKLFQLRLDAFVGSATGIGAWLTVVFMIAAFSQVVVGHLIDRYPLKSVFLLVGGLHIPMMVLGATAAGGWLLVSAPIMMAVVFGLIPINDTIVARYVGAEWRSRAYALKYLLSFGVSASVVPLVGWVHDATGGFETLYVILTVFAVSIFAVAALMPGRRAVAAVGASA
jgi:MFS family permease